MTGPARADQSDTTALIPVDTIEGREAQRTYLVEQGWTEDGKQLRWGHEGKRTLPKALREQRQREIADAADELRTCDDPLQLRRAFRSSERTLRNAAMASPHLPSGLLDEAYDAGEHAAVAAAPALTDEQLARILPPLVARAHEQLDRPTGSWALPGALVSNTRVPLDTRLGLVRRSFEWQLPHGPVATATRCSDPELIGAVVDDVLERLEEAYSLEEFRQLVELLTPAARNPAAGARTLERLASLHHHEIDLALRANPELPARLYREIVAVTETRIFADVRLDAVGWRDTERSARTAQSPQRLWLVQRDRRDVLKSPEQASVALAELPDGDLVMALDVGDADQYIGPLLWVLVALPRSPFPLHYRGYSHGATDEDALRFLRHIAPYLLTDWPAIRQAYLEREPEALTRLAIREEAAARRRGFETATEAVRYGADDRAAARQLDVPVAELREAAKAPRRYRAGEPTLQLGQVTYSSRPRIGLQLPGEQLTDEEE